MKDNTSTLDEVRKAKETARDALAAFPVVGIGITRVGAGYGIKVNLSESVAEGTMPETIGGVPIRTEVVGKITKR